MHEPRAAAGTALATANHSFSSNMTLQSPLETAIGETILKTSSWYLLLIYPFPSFQIITLIIALSGISSLENGEITLFETPKREEKMLHRTTLQIS